jgi:hypothetical protein
VQTSKKRTRPLSRKYEHSRFMVCWIDLTRSVCQENVRYASMFEFITRHEAINAHITSCPPCSSCWWNGHCERVRVGVLSFPAFFPLQHVHVREPCLGVVWWMMWCWLCFAWYYIAALTVVARIIALNGRYKHELPEHILTRTAWSLPKNRY